MFSVLIEIVEAALLSYKMFPCRLPEFSMFCKKNSLHVSMQHVKSSSNLDLETTAFSRSGMQSYSFLMVS